MKEKKLFLTSLKQICNECLIKFSENQSAPKLENRKTSPCSPCAPNLPHVLVSRIPGYHNLCSPVNNCVFDNFLHQINPPKKLIPPPPRPLGETGSVEHFLASCKAFYKGAQPIRASVYTPLPPQNGQCPNTWTAFQKGDYLTLTMILTTLAVTVRLTVKKMI